MLITCRLIRKSTNLTLNSFQEKWIVFEILWITALIKYNYR